MSDYDEQYRAFNRFLSIPSSEARDMERATGATAPSYTHWVRDSTLPHGACSLTADDGAVIILRPEVWQDRPEEMRAAIRRWMLEHTDLHNWRGPEGSYLSDFWVQEWKKANPLGCPPRSLMKKPKKKW